MSDKLLKALQAVVTEIKSMHPIELTEALKEASKSEFSQTIDILNHFTSAIRLNRSDDGDRLTLNTPIENNQPITIKAPCLFIEDKNLPIENIPTLSQTDTEDLPNTGLVSKTPHRNITTYTDKWYIDHKDE